jgi:hypothetical protein
LLFRIMDIPAILPPGSQARTPPAPPENLRKPEKT